MGIVEKELKILHVDLVQLIVSLEQLWAVRESMWSVCDHYYDKKNGSLKKESNKRVRIRYWVEWNKVTLKERIPAKNIKKAQEEEFYIKQWTCVDTLLSKRWLFPSRQKYKTRVTYRYGSIQYDIDLYPWIPPLVEIEADSYKKIKEGIKKAGLAEYTTSTSWARWLMKRYWKKPVPLRQPL